MEKTVLDNGATIISEKNNSKSCGLVVGVRFGSLYEKDEDAGIAHFFEHLFLRATKNRPSKELISGLISQKGGYMNARTSTYWTFIECKVLSKDLDLALEISFDCLNNLIMDEKAIKDEKPIVHSEMHLKYDNPKDYQSRLFYATLYKNHPIGRPVVGYKDTLDSITINKLKNIHSKYYSSNNFILTYTGNVNHQQLIRKVRHLFPKHKNKIEKPNLNDIKLTGRIYDEDIRHNLKQCTITVGNFAPKTTDKYFYAFDILNTILGRGINSRFYKEIRIKRSLSYSIHSQYSANKFFGNFMIVAVCNKDNLKAVEHIVLNEFEAIKTNLTEKEVSGAKEQLINNFILNNEDTLKNTVTLFINEINALKKNDYIKNINKVTLEGVKAATRNYLDTKNYAVVVIRN